MSGARKEMGNNYLTGTEFSCGGIKISWNYIEAMVVHIVNALNNTASNTL